MLPVYIPTMLASSYMHEEYYLLESHILQNTIYLASNCDTYPYNKKM